MPPNKSKQNNSKQSKSKQAVVDFRGTAGAYPGTLAFDVGEGEFVVYREHQGERVAIQQANEVFTSELGFPDGLDPKSEVKLVGKKIFWEILRRYGIRDLAMVELTPSCNLRCKHCYIPSREADPPETRHPRLADNIETLQASLQKMKVLEIGLTGGEVFLIDNFLEIADMLSKHFVVSVLTNATIMKPDDITQLSKIPLKAVKTSIYSLSPEVHDSITQVPGSFEKTRRAIELMRSSGIRVQVNVPLLKENLPSLSATKEWLSSEGLEFFIDSLVFPTNSDQRAMIPEPWEIAEEVRKGVLPKPVNALCSAYCAKLRIDWFGDVHPCEYIQRPLGNIFSNDLDDPSLYEKLLSARDNKPVINRTVCDCELESKCFKCAARNILESGNYATHSKYLCDLAKCVNDPNVFRPS